jgi:hypothetical protein
MISGLPLFAACSRWSRPVAALLCSLALQPFISKAVTAQPRYAETMLEATATGEEISSQPGLWVMEVYFKPLRMIAVDITNPDTGKKEPRFVTYLVYRVINRSLASPAPVLRAVNELDAPVLPEKFIPEFTLVTTDGDKPQVYHDQILPEALAAIERRERRKHSSTVNVVEDVPPAVAKDAPEQNEIYGVATFLGVDPEADRYTLYLTGFSNGVKTVTSPDGGTVVQNKTIEMKYWRPGDEFDRTEPELRLEGQPRWIYR